MVYNAGITTAAQLQAYLSTLPGLTVPGSVNVAGNVGGPFTLTFASGVNGTLLSAVSGPAQITLPGADQLTFRAASGNVTLAYNSAQAPVTPAFTYGLATTTPALLETYLSSIPGLTAPGCINVTGNEGGPFTITFGPGLNPALLATVSGPAAISRLSTQTECADSRGHHDPGARHRLFLYIVRLSDHVL